MTDLRNLSDKFLDRSWKLHRAADELSKHYQDKAISNEDFDKLQLLLVKAAAMEAMYEELSYLVQDKEIPEIVDFASQMISNISKPIR